MHLDSVKLLYALQHLQQIHDMVLGYKMTEAMLVIHCE